MSGRFTDSKVQEFLGSFNQVWLGLAHESPEISSPYSAEINGAAYERMRILMSQPEGRYVANATGCRFSGLPAVRITHLLGWDQSINGNLDFFIALPTPMRIQLGRSFVVDSGDIVLSID